eukprot:CAMPEP_0184452696 /NCGR_PEP_ID=MMETSP0740-20130409/14002_1 /TAXON_ID=385413 /ORGANISM="Thalassiosira miniscula, Strain CCMP1093" /LENGTH=40 /DNA_ID= /DNA_START= /DNA_END= /DNA_ORIENTATION=
MRDAAKIPGNILRPKALDNMWGVLRQRRAQDQPLSSDDYG